LVSQGVLFPWHLSPVVVVVLELHYLTAAPFPGSAVLQGLSEASLIVGQIPKGEIGHRGAFYSLFANFT
jgi:hypothetical protein